jgi:hypothetical protein
VIRTEESYLARVFEGGVELLDASAADHRQRLPGIVRAWKIRRLESALEGLPRLRPITGLNVRHTKMELMERIAGIALDAFFE